MRSRLGLSARYAAIAACSFACSGSNDGPIDVGSSASGGGAQQTFGGGTSTATGSSGGSGGSVAASTGGTSSVNGTATGGSNPVSGGNTGTVAVGGSATGGATNKGGSTATGGSATNGGSTATGGATNKGGSTATGGATNKGGSTATGGSTANGGSTATGGATAKGGTSAGGTGTGGASVGGTATGGTMTGDACVDQYKWPAYSPTVSYDYEKDIGVTTMPTAVSADVSGIAGTYHNGGWWSFIYGGNKNSLVTEKAWIPMVKRFEDDFAYITDVMRWPRDGRARGGHKSAIYLYGSGLSSDSASNTATGGWQGGTKDGPMVNASYYPVYSFDPACTYSDKVTQQGAMIHEGIHCILSTMSGCQQSCWFNEAGNTWLQANMEVKRSGKAPTSMGFLSAAAAVAPFMPIECYSGWLQDGSFGGPCAQNVEKKNSAGVKISTWRNLLGGTQYGETFAHAMGVILGDGAMAWVFKYATKSGRLLQDLAEVTTPSPGIGPVQTRRLIQEYRARQAFGDFGVWSTAYKNLLNAEWNTNITAQDSEPGGILQDCEAWKATPYVKTSLNGTTLTPEERTLPGWSGANEIPLKIAADATCVTVNFKPTGANMSCQLVYRDTTGAIHYGTPVTTGACSVPVSNVKNSVVIAVLSNTDYIFDGGLKKYGYTIDIGTGITGTADINTKWYQ